MSVILNPVEQYFDVDGSPLQSGYLYFGEVYGNPVTQPVMVYFDPEFTIPAAQPVRTINGYPVRSGTATGIYAPDDVSILVQNQNKEQVIYIQSSAINTGDTTTIYRESDITFNADDNNRTFIMLSPFTQTFDAASTLGDRWRVNIINMSGGDVILNPNLSETIDGQSTLTLTANQTVTVYCDGVNLFTNLLSIKIVPDDPYSDSGWNGSLQVPTKNAIRDILTNIINSRIGTVFLSSLPTAPSGSIAVPLVATNVSRTTYATLNSVYAAQGYPWGSGDGSTTFGIPYLQADGTWIQANGNVGTVSNGLVQSHTHTDLLIATVQAGANNIFASRESSSTTKPATDPNLAAGSRGLWCIWVS